MAVSEATLLRLTEIVARHGDHAMLVARKHRAECETMGSTEGTLLWSRVMALLARQMTRPPAAPSPPEPASTVEVSQGPRTPGRNQP
jgi:hypothetical protein